MCGAGTSACATCHSIAARTAPGGCIHETDHWFVDHCVGPLGVGTLIVKPKRHVVHVWQLDESEAAELGPLLRRVTAALSELVQPDQVYVDLWSHQGGKPVHIHWVVQPVTRELMDEIGDYGPQLQVAMFEANETPPREEVVAFAERARALLG
jgi:diadenosine tetraphosphate (Ap4A) HIT family hydrolase